MFLSALPLIINQERPLQGKIEIIRRCLTMNIKIFFSLYRRNNGLSHNSIVQQHFLTEIFFPLGTKNKESKDYCKADLKQRILFFWNGNSRRPKRV